MNGLPTPSPVFQFIKFPEKIISFPDTIVLIPLMPLKEISPYKEVPPPPGFKECTPLWTWLDIERQFVSPEKFTDHS